MDIQTLGVNVKSQGIAEASNDLNLLADAGAKAEKATISLTNSVEKLIAKYQQVADFMGKSTSQTSQLASAQVEANRAIAMQTEGLNSQVSSYKAVAQAQANSVSTLKMADAAQQATVKSAKDVAAANKAVQDMLDLNAIKLTKSKGDWMSLKATQMGASDEMIAKAKQVGDEIQHTAEKGEGAMGKLGLGTVGAKRELMVLAHEAMTGNFSRIPGSMLVLAERMEGMGALITLLINPFTILAAVVGTIGFLALDGAHKIAEFNNNLVMTNNASGMTATSLNMMAEGLTGSGVSARHMKEILTGLSATGVFTGETIQSIGVAAMHMAEVTGQSTEDTLKFYEGLGDGALEWAVKHNKSMGSMDDATYAQIRALQEAGQAQEAMRLAVETFDVTADAHITKMGIVSGTWWGFKQLLSIGADWANSIGEPATATDKLSTETAKLERLERQLMEGRKNGLDKAGQEAYKAMIKNQQGIVIQAQNNVSGESKAAADASRRTELKKAAAASEAELEDMRKATRSKEEIRRDEISKLEINWANKIKLAQDRGEVIVGVEDKIQADIVRIEEKYKDKAGKKPRSDFTSGYNDQIAKLEEVAKSTKAAYDYEMYAADAYYKFGQISEQEMLNTKQQILTQEKALTQKKYDDEIAIAQQYYDKAKDQVAKDQMSKNISNLQKKAAEEELNYRRALLTVGLEQEAMQGKSEEAIQKYLTSLEKENAKLAENKSVQHELASVIAAKEAATIRAAEAESNRYIIAQEQLLTQAQLEASNIAATTASKSQVQAINDKVVMLTKNIEAAKSASDMLNKVASAGETKAGMLSEKEANIAADKAAKAYENAWKASYKKVEDGLYTAISEGGNKAGQKLMKDLKEWFARLVLSPIIQPIASFGASLLNPNAANAQGSLGGTLASGGNLFSNIGSGISNAYNMFTGGATAAYTNFAMGGMGQAMGLSTAGTASMDAFSSAISAGSTTAEALMVSTEAGSATLTTLGSIGSSLATVAPYLAAAALLYQGLQMGDKQITGQRLTGTLGTQDFTRNVDWSQQGGFLRSNRSGTWGYNLGTSTAMADGVAYTDTASQKSDTSLLSNITTAYSALKDGSAVMAKQLGIDAAYLKDRTQAISGDLGSTAADIQKNLTEIFTNVGNDISKELLYIGDNAGMGLSTLAKQGETATQTLTRLAANVTGVNDVMSLFSYKTYDLTKAGIKASDELVTLFGSLSNFQSISASYFQNYYTAAEQMSLQTQHVSDSFTALGYTMPKTRDDLRAMIEAAKALGTEAGDKTYADLMKLTTSFTAITPVIQSNTKAQEMQAQILELQGKTTEALAIKRKIELDAMDASLRPLQERINALTDEATAKATADALAAKSTDLQITLLGLQGNSTGALALTRQKEIASLEKTLIPLQQYIYRLEDLQTALDNSKTATNNTLAAVQKSVDKQKSILDAAYTEASDALKTKLDADKKANELASKAAQDTLTKMTSLVDKLKTALGVVVAQTDDLTRAQRSNAQGILNNALTTAQAGGSLANFTGLEDALTTVSKPSEDLFASFVDYALDQGKTNGVISLLYDNASAQKSVAQLTLDALTAGNNATQTNYDKAAADLDNKHKEQIAALDAQLQKAQDQVDVLNGIDIAVLSVADAVKQLGVAMAAQAAAASALKTAQTGSASGTTPTSGVTMKSGAAANQIPLSSDTLWSQGIDTSSASSTADGKLLMWERQQVDKLLNDPAFLSSMGLSADQQSIASSYTSSLTSLAGQAGSSTQGLDYLNRNDITAAAWQQIGKQYSLFDPKAGAGSTSLLNSGSFTTDAEYKAFLSSLGVPAFASGGSYAGGLALVGEKGAELINFNQGGNVYTADQTAAILNSQPVDTSDNKDVDNTAKSVEIRDAIDQLRDVTQRIGERMITLTLEMKKLASKNDVLGMPPVRDTVV